MLSLKETKLTAPAIREAENKPGGEESAYSNSIKMNPHVKVLVERMDLVSAATSKPIPCPTSELAKETIVYKEKLVALAEKILADEICYTEGQIIAMLQKQTRANPERSKRGFDLMLQPGIIAASLDLELYYLTDSSPF